MVLHLVYLPRINNVLHAFVQEWNNHPVTSACHYTPLQMWVQGIVNSRNTDYSALNDVLLNRQDVDFLGVDEEGPIPKAQTANNVEVAEIPYDLTNEQEEAVEEIRQRCSLDVDGITCYLQVLQYIASVLGIE